MQKNWQANGADERRLLMPDAAPLIDAQREASENAIRIAKAAWQNVLSVNKAWMEFWDKHLDEYLELPKRFFDAQAEFMHQAADHYQESLQKLGNLATKAAQDAQSAAKETQVAGEGTAQKLQSDMRDFGRGNSQVGNQEHREGQQQSAAR